MQLQTSDEIIGELVGLCNEDMATPFPYADCQKLLRTTSSRTRRYTGFVPDLNMYFSNLAGYCSWKKKMLRWPDEKVHAVYEELALSFFQKHEQYKPLADRITAHLYPDLYAMLALYEQIRSKMLIVLTLLIEEKRASCADDSSS